MRDPKRDVRPAPLQKTCGAAPEGAPDLPAVRLASVGQVFVTAAAAERYAQFSRQLPEAARKELTSILLDAKLVREEGDKSHWRARSRSHGVDASAVTVREGRLLVVVAVHVRGADR